MSRFNEKQLVLMTVGAAALLAGGFGVLTWLDVQAVYANEVTDENPSAAEVANEEEWGERRKIQEIKKQMDAAQAEASLIGKREIDVIVYREIVARDAAILPEVDDVNNLADTIDDYVKQSGVALRQVSDLSIHPGGEAIKQMPIKLSVSGSFDQFLKFLNLFENLDRIINVRGFSVQGGHGAGGREKKVVHDIQLDLVTYIYSPAAGISKPVDVANYDHRKEDPAIQRLVRQQKPARVDKYQLKPRINRRDPLVDARRPGGGDAAAGDPADVQKQRELVDHLKFELEILKADVQQEEQFVAEKKYVPLATLKPLIDAKCGKLDQEIAAAVPLITAGELREAFNDDVVGPFEAIKGRRKLVALPVLFTAAEACTFLEQEKTAINAGQYEKVVKTLVNFDALVANKTVAEDAAPVINEMRAIAKEAKVMLEFAALRLKVDGLVLQPGGSIVLINHKSFKVGDAIDQAGRCRLKEIHEQKLMFELDGFDIEHQLAKK